VAIFIELRSELMKKTVTYVLFADGARARIYVNEGPGKGLHAVSGATHKADLHRHSRDVKSDKPGRTIDAATGQRSSMEPHQDWHRFEKHKFAHEMAKVIDAAAANKAFDRLILVAPPTTLGDLRMELDEQTMKLVSGQLPKDLTRHPEHDLAQHLDGVIAL
jgi:protein required for attachment to host cells